MSDYALGVVTPFAAIAALALALGAAYLMASGARKLWASTHYRLIQTVQVRTQQLASFAWDGDHAAAERRAAQTERRERIRKANLVRDGLIRGPGKIVAIEALGFHLLVVRAYRETKRDSS